MWSKNDPMDLPALLPMLDHPLEQCLITHTSIGNGQSHMNQLRIRTANLDAVHFKKGEHHIDADPFVAVHKGMIGNQSITEPRSLFFFAGIEFMITKAGKRRFQRGIQQSFIAYADASAGGSEIPGTDSRTG